MADGILVINSGSTSVKFAIYSFAKDAPLTMEYRGQVKDLQSKTQFEAFGPDHQPLDTHTWPENQPIDHTKALLFIVRWLAHKADGVSIAAVGHRIVLGGDRYSGPVFIEGDVLDYLDGLSVMEPSHQPANVTGARALAKAFEDLPQVACFDNSFHRSMPEVAQVYALSSDLRQLGVRHWGYHGLSFEYIGSQIKHLIPTAQRVIIAHLGGGCSLCAMLDGKSIDTTMGFSGLSGLPMSTRSGDLPPEVLFYLLRRGYDAKSLEKTLYYESGLRGLSRLSGDMLELLDSSAPEATLAVNHFIYQVAKYTGAYIAVLGGLDAFVFTGGIGENSTAIRSAICRRLTPLGIELEETANQQNQSTISSANSKISVWVVPTNEELMIAQHTLDVIQSRGLLSLSLSSKDDSSEDGNNLSKSNG